MSTSTSVASKWGGSITTLPENDVKRPRTSVNTAYRATNWMAECVGSTAHVPASGDRSSPA